VVRLDDGPMGLAASLRPPVIPEQLTPRAQLDVPGSPLGLPLGP
jgi:hypothetical protein